MPISWNIRTNGFLLFTRPANKTEMLSTANNEAIGADQSGICVVDTAMSASIIAVIPAANTNPL